MISMVKDILRQILLFLHLDITRNLRYDRLANRIYKRLIKPGMNTIDVGSHKGEVLEIFVKLGRGGTHFAFEPIPHMAAQLRRKFPMAQVLDCALASSTGEVTFQYVRNAPAYSGLKKRAYAVKHPDIQEITVQCKRLDDVIHSSQKIDLIKIDTEGAELEVLKGAGELLKRNTPVLLFEFGLGSSEYYKAGPDEMFAYLHALNYRIYSLSAFLNGDPAYTADTFRQVYQSNREYYFVAADAKRSY